MIRVGLRTSDLPPAPARAPVRHAREMLAWALEVVERRFSPPSSTGLQLRYLEEGVVGDDGALWRSAQAGARADRDFLKAEDLLSRLTPEERMVVELQHAPLTMAVGQRLKCTCSREHDRGAFRPLNKARPSRLRRKRVLCSFCTWGGGRHLVDNSIAVRRQIADTELQELKLDQRVLEPNVAPSVRITRDGAEFVHRAAAPPPVDRVVDADGRREVVFTAPTRAAAVVEERRAPRRSHADIAAALGLSERRVRTRIEAAQKKVRDVVRRWHQEELNGE